MIYRLSRLSTEHELNLFDCGKESLNLFLQKYAWTSQQGHGAVTYVAVDGKRVIAYYSVSYGSVMPVVATERIKKGMGKYPIPVFLLARLAVDKIYQRRGLGYSLLQNALLRACKVSKEAGLRAVIVDALDRESKEFYLKYGFESSPVDEMRLFFLLKDVKRTLGLD